MITALRQRVSLPKVHQDWELLLCYFKSVFFLKFSNSFILEITGTMVPVLHYITAGLWRGEHIAEELYSKKLSEVDWNGQSTATPSSPMFPHTPLTSQKTKTKQIHGFRSHVWRYFQIPRYFLIPFNNIEKTGGNLCYLRNCENG